MGIEFLNILGYNTMLQPLNSYFTLNLKTTKNKTNTDHRTQFEQSPVE